jgi:hypothetical protein
MEEGNLSTGVIERRVADAGEVSPGKGSFRMS